MGDARNCVSLKGASDLRVSGLNDVLQPPDGHKCGEQRK